MPEVSFELAFTAGAIAFYLYDCVLLLYGNELVCVRRGQHWHATTGGDFTLFGKRVILPAPLTPWALLFRGAWSETDARVADSAPWPPAPFVRALRPLQILCTTMLAVLLVVLPAVALGFGTGIALLAVFAAFYLLAASALAIVIARRAVLGVNGKALASLVVDALACPPFAINFVRKLSLRLALPGDPLAFVASRFEPAEAQRVNALVRERVDEFLAVEPAGSARVTRLLLLRDRLLGSDAR